MGFPLLIHNRAIIMARYALLLLIVASVFCAVAKSQDQVAWAYWGARYQQVVEPSGATKLNITRVSEGTYCLSTQDGKGISNYASVQITIQVSQDLSHPVLGTALVNTAVGGILECDGIDPNGKVFWTYTLDGKLADLDFSIMVGDRFF